MCELFYFICNQQCTDKICDNCVCTFAFKIIISVCKVHTTNCSMNQFKSSLRFPSLVRNKLVFLI